MRSFRAQPGGPLTFYFFWWVCAAQVFKSRLYRIDFFFKKLGSGEQIFAKIRVFGAEILPKSERNGPKNAEFFEKGKPKSIRTDASCKKVGLWSGGEA